MPTTTTSKPKTKQTDPNETNMQSRDQIINVLKQWTDQNKLAAFSFILKDLIGPRLIRNKSLVTYMNQLLRDSTGISLDSSFQILSRKLIKDFVRKEIDKNIHEMESMRKQIVVLRRECNSLQQQIKEQSNDGLDDFEINMDIFDEI